VVSSPEVKQPVAVRYGWANFPSAISMAATSARESFSADNFLRRIFQENVGQPFQGIRTESGDAITSFAAALLTNGAGSRLGRPADSNCERLQLD